jgi:hypothetical protein
MKKGHKGGAFDLKDMEVLETENVQIFPKTPNPHIRWLACERQAT